MYQPNKKRLFQKKKNYIRISTVQNNYSYRCNKPASKLNPLFIPKYENQLFIPPVFEPIVVKGQDEKGQCKTEHLYNIDIGELRQQMLPKGYPKTTVWGYGGMIREPGCSKVRYFRGSPGPTFEAIQGIPVKVKWINKLCGRHPFPVDPTLHWANPNHMPMDPPKPWPMFPPGFREAQKSIPAVTHLHGGEVSSLSDGYPEAWFTYDGQHGPAFTSNQYYYPNAQEPATLWYHDHTMGITRLNVYAGLAGFYLLREGKNSSRGCWENSREFKLPKGKYEIPIVIQDRMFLSDGSLLYDNIGINPGIHPYWVPQFLGDTIVVNGRVWPNLEVDRCQYRFRILNGSNARFYQLKLSNGMEFIQIGSDGGFLPKPVKCTALLLAPAERADILIDFSSVEPGTRIKLLNEANAPYPDGGTPDPATVGQIMQFAVNCSEPVKPVPLPDCLNDMPRLCPDRKRILTLYEVKGPNGPREALLDGLKWSFSVTETPEVGSTEEWEIVNLTMGTHPIHLHLVQFQLLNRQCIDAEKYRTYWEACNGAPPLYHKPKTVALESYLSGPPIPPEGNEAGWKDTVRMNPGQVTRILIRFAPQNISQCWLRPGDNLFPFNPAEGPGYVWHCHILDHEDNEMMRPYKVRN